jgi:hypothetical protein
VCVCMDDDDDVSVSIPLSAGRQSLGPVSVSSVSQSLSVTDSVSCLT